MNEILDNLLDARWKDAVNDPPSDDRLVRVAWDDGGTEQKAFCFYYSKREIY